MKLKELNPNIKRALLCMSFLLSQELAIGHFCNIFEPFKTSEILLNTEGETGPFLEADVGKLSFDKPGEHAAERGSGMHIVKRTAQQETYCSSIDCIRESMSAAQPGDEIVVAPGTYQFTNGVYGSYGRWSYLYASNNGTAELPIVLRAQDPDNPPVFVGYASLRGCLLNVDGDHWIFKDLDLQYGAKGIIMDNANHCQLINLSVHEIGDEAIHLRDGSSYNVIQSCSVYNTGLSQPPYGEGLYIGSDKGQHDFYSSDCDYNTIEYCVIGPNVAAEGVDVKEGTSYTIVRYNTFSAAGISGENSADAFVDLKGEYGFVYGNEFNVDGSEILSAGVDFLDRGVDESGFRLAVFNNVFHLGDRADEISTIRRRQGDPEEVHLWGNTRVPASGDFPVSNGSERYVTLSCPEWNIEPCEGDENEAPTVSFISPQDDVTVQVGYELLIEVEAIDDEEVASVQLFVDGDLLEEETAPPYQWLQAGLSEGEYLFTVLAFDEQGVSTSDSFTLTVESMPLESLPIPGVVQAEDYSDATEGRTELTEDIGGGLNVGWIDSGEYLEYMVEVQEAGTYDIGYRVAALSQNVYFQVSANGLDVDLVNTTATGDWQTWKTVTTELVLEEGVQPLRVTALGGGWNINWISFDLSEPVDNVSTCNFNTPLAHGLPSINRSFSYVHVLGQGGPAFDNFREFTINWNLPNSGLYQFAFNTNNGAPGWYVNFSRDMIHNLGNSQPQLTLSATGFDGLDGSYWVALDDENFVMVSTTSDFTLYFSEAAEAPVCEEPSVAQMELFEEPVALVVYPNPSSEVLYIDRLPPNTESVAIFNVHGFNIESKAVKSGEASRSFNIQHLESGIYFVMVRTKGNQVQKVRFLKEQ